VGPFSETVDGYSSWCHWLIHIGPNGSQDHDCQVRLHTVLSHGCSWRSEYNNTNISDDSNNNNASFGLHYQHLCLLFGSYYWPVRTECKPLTTYRRHMETHYCTLLWSAIHLFNTFLLRNTLQCKARSCYRMSSAHLSVRLSVTSVDHDHIGWKSLKLFARTISPTSSLFVAQTSSTPRGTWRNFGENGGGVGKSGVLEHKSGNISETC